MMISALVESSNDTKRACMTAVAIMKKCWTLVLSSCVVYATTPATAQDGRNQSGGEIVAEAGIREIAVELVENTGSLIRWDPTLFPLKVLVATPTSGAATQCTMGWLQTLQETIGILNKNGNFLRLLVGENDAPDVFLLFVSIDGYAKYADKIERRVVPNNWKLMLEISDPIERLGLAKPWNNDAIFLAGDGRFVKLAVAFAEQARDDSASGPGIAPCVPEILAADLLKALFGQAGLFAVGLSEKRFGKGHFLDVVVPALGLVLQAQYRARTQEAPSREELLRHLSKN